MRRESWCTDIAFVTARWPIRVPCALRQLGCPHGIRSQCFVFVRQIRLYEVLHLLPTHPTVRNLNEMRGRGKVPQQPPLLQSMRILSFRNQSWDLRVGRCKQTGQSYTIAWEICAGEKDRFFKLHQVLQYFRLFAATLQATAFCSSRKMAGQLLEMRCAKTSLRQQRHESARGPLLQLITLHKNPPRRSSLKQNA